ncbi:ribokinase [Microbacterium oxydans]|uniref:ribokinase n=1 Tax=Microbacterium oxydans TaxID=82380 RepID=UPI0022B11EC1|nr:ribokinase [Microbacterium oxydans]MCZ4302568.1 ribokinase [Microbacterium oxydans]
MRVVVVGSINQDVVAHVERIPSPGETVLASSMLRSGGGKGANQAVAARRAGGAEVAFVGAVGVDVEGTQLRRALEHDGIDVAGLAQLEGPSGIALISVDSQAENAIVVIPGANGRIISLSDSQRTVVAEAGVLLTQLEIPLSLVAEAAAGRRADAWHVLNAAPASPLASEGVELRGFVDVLIVNEHEALDVSGTDHVAEAVAVLSARVPALVVTLGGAGSIVVCGGERVDIRSFPVEAVDTTGAGDTFCGVFAATLAASGRAPDSVDVSLLAAAARAGAAAAALAVTRLGAQDAVPSAADVAALLIEGASS